MKTLSIGIGFVDDRRDGSSWLVNGHAQNVKFLHDLFLLMGHAPVFIVPSDEVRERNIQGRVYRQIDTKSATQGEIQFDIVIEASHTMSEDERSAYRKNSDAKIISIRYGNTFFIDVESVFVKKDLEGTVHVSKPDMIWTSPHYERYSQYLSCLYHAECQIAPYIWEPHFAPNPFNATNFDDVLDIYVMEPNFSVIKNALIPMLIIDQMFLENPDAFVKATICNARDFQDTPGFLNNFVRNLTSQHGPNDKVFFADRGGIGDVFKRPGVLLGHHHQNALNYLYFEALYMGLPLVHNSEFMKDVGYYYDEFDISSGKRALLEALTNHHYSSSMKAAKPFLQQYSIHNESVQESYQTLLEQALKS